MSTNQKNLKRVNDFDNDHDTKRRKIELIDLVNKQDLKKIKKLLKEDNDVDINQKDENKNTALIIASRMGYTEIVKLLIKYNTDLEEKNNNGTNALISAAEYGRFEEVKLLLENGADKNEKNNNGDTALMIANLNWINLKKEDPLKGSFFLITKLLEKDETVLLKLILKKNLEGVKNLFKENKDINLNQKDTYKQTVLIIAIRLGCTEIVRLLLKNGANPNKKDGIKMTALITAINYKRFEEVNLLVEYGANINEKNNNGDTALMIANLYYIYYLKKENPLKEKFSSIIKLLKKNENFLIKLIEKKDLEEIKRLLKEDKNININKKNNSKNTALIIASCMGYTQIVKLLLKYNADIEEKNNYGMTALMLATKYGRFEEVKLLLERGANINKNNNNGDTALMIANSNWLSSKKEDPLKEKFFSIATLLKKNEKLMKPIYEEILKATKNGNLDKVESYFKDNVDDINQKDTTKDSIGDTGLIYASKNGHLEIVKLLFIKDADINIKNNFGKTALMYASSRGHLEIVEFLIEKGAVINQKNSNTKGKTALIYASDHGHIDIIKLLLDNNAHIN